MKKGNYDGVSCVMTGQEARFLLRYADGLRKTYPSDRLIMIGIAESMKSLVGIPTRHNRRFAKLDDIEDIFTDHPLALNIIHYATNNLSTLAYQLMQVASYAGPNLHGFQLNTDWPPVTELCDLKKNFRNTRIIYRLLVPVWSGQDLASSCEQIAEKLGKYIFANDYKLIDDVLIDFSGGRGQLIDLPSAVLYSKMLKKNAPWLNFGLAGGLGPESIHLMDQIIMVDKKLNWDAESGLRNEDNDLDPDKTRQYLLKLAKKHAENTLINKDVMAKSTEIGEFQ